MWTGRECIQWRVGLEQGTEWPDGSLATPAQERRRKNLASSKGYAAIQLRMQMRVNPSKIQLPHLLSCEIKFTHLCADAQIACIYSHPHAMTYTCVQIGVRMPHPAGSRCVLCKRCNRQTGLQTNYATQRRGTVAHLSNEK